MSWQDWELKYSAHQTTRARLSLSSPSRRSFGDDQIRFRKIHYCLQRGGVVRGTPPRRDNQQPARGSLQRVRVSAAVIAGESIALGNLLVMNADRLLEALKAQLRLMQKAALELHRHALGRFIAPGTCRAFVIRRNQNVHGWSPSLVGKS